MLIKSNTNKTTTESLKDQITDLIIIEDDEIFAKSLAMYLKSKSMKIEIFSSPKSFLEHLSEYPKETKICTDNKFLEDSTTGIELTKKLFKNGYKNLFLLSGKEFAEDETPPFLKVITKGDMKGLNQLL